MHLGLGLTFQNLIKGQTDAEVYRNELALAARAEDDGFDSLWTPEHHFTDYMLTPIVSQFLSWVAGRTKRIKLGTMVTVLPWWEPIRVAESFTLLDHLSEGRAILGLGRGLGRVEFDAFRLNMNESTPPLYRVRRRNTPGSGNGLHGVRRRVVQAAAR